MVTITIYDGLIPLSIPANDNAKLRGLDKIVKDQATYYGMSVKEFSKTMHSFAELAELITEQDEDKFPIHPFK